VLDDWRNEHITMQPQFHIVIRQHKGVLFNDAVAALSGVNSVGPFDILPHHAHFVSIIREYVVLHTNQGKKRIDFSKGVLRVFEDTIEIYVGI